MIGVTRRTTARSDRCHGKHLLITRGIARWRRDPLVGLRPQSIVARCGDDQHSLTVQPVHHAEQTAVCIVKQPPRCGVRLWACIGLRACRVCRRQPACPMPAWRNRDGGTQAQVHYQSASSTNPELSRQTRQHVAQTQCVANPGVVQHPNEVNLGIRCDVMDDARHE